MKKRLTQDTKRDILFALFISSMVTVNILGTKITSIFGVRVSVGIFFMPVLFLITDIVGEVYGSRHAQGFVNIAAGILVLLFLTTFLCISVKPEKTWTFQEQYALIFGSTLRMTLASLVSFIISQKLDVALFAFFRKITDGKKLWVRNNVSTIVSQFIDTVVFEFIAFWHINEHYTAGFLFTLIIPYWLFKTVFALLDTPFCYLGVRWLRGKEDPAAQA